VTFYFSPSATGSTAPKRRRSTAKLNARPVRNSSGGAMPERSHASVRELLDRVVAALYPPSADLESQHMRQLYESYKV
jgi:hypothetical protein